MEPFFYFICYFLKYKFNKSNFNTTRFEIIGECHSREVKKF